MELREKDDIEITTLMMKAGRAVLGWYNPDINSVEDTVASIYRAMAQASRRDSKENP